MTLGNWARDVEWLWSQDDCVPDEDTVDRAWRRLFGGSHRDVAWIDQDGSFDDSDAVTMVDQLGRVYLSSYPGANQIGVVRGSRSDVHPRRIISGGQTGADQGALFAALAFGHRVNCGGWAPAGWRTEDGQVPEVLRAHMQESSSGDYLSRTIENIQDSDGTLILSLSGRLSGGSERTREQAGRRRKPCLHLSIGSAEDRLAAPALIRQWAEEHRIGVMNVAGPRESKEPGIGQAVREVMECVLQGALVEHVDGWRWPPPGGDRAAPSSSVDQDDGQVDEHDFGGATRGRFFRPGARVRMPGLGQAQADDDAQEDDAPDDHDPIADDSGGDVLDPEIRDEHDERVRSSVLAASAAPARRASRAISWSPGQEAAIRGVQRWMADPHGSQVCGLFGAAGTGKSTLVQELVGASPRRWLYAAYTGKAALVMRQKGCVGAQTIHSLIYRPDGDSKSKSKSKRDAPARPDRRPIDWDSDVAPIRDQPTFRLWGESPLRDAPGIVLDECSMVDEEIGMDLLSFGKKILVCGDPHQLPPVSGGGFFTDGDPDFLLTEVHRQARESGILDLATHIREGGDLQDRVGWSSSSGDCDVISRDHIAPTELMMRMVAADQVILGTNRSRHQFNDRYRRLSQITSPTPVAGDRVICLRNERRTGLFNGSMWRVMDARLSADGAIVEMDLLTTDGTQPGEVTTRSWTHHFTGRERVLDEMGPRRISHQEFDFAYYVTCHKAQGSQWDDVVLYDESRVFDDDTRRRWLYTGITRAARRLTVVA